MPLRASRSSTGCILFRAKAFLLETYFWTRNTRRGDDDSDDGDSGCKAVAAAHLVDELSVKDNREGTVALTDQHRGAEVCKGSHEHQQSRSQQGGHDQGYDHFEEAGNARASEVLSRLDEGVVDVLQCTLGVEEHQREQLERHDQHDAAEAVDVGMAMPRFLKKAVMTPLRPSSRIHE